MSSTLNILQARKALRGSSPLVAASSLRDWLGLESDERVNLHAAFARLGVQFEVAPELEAAGHASLLDGIAKIQLRDSGHKGRNRFTAAHELGHLLMHELPEDGAWRDRDPAVMYDQFSPTTDRLTRRMETEANQFASALLMPLEGVLKWARANGFDNNRLAQHFGVSPTAMGIALAQATGTPYSVKFVGPSGLHR